MDSVKNNYIYRTALTGGMLNSKMFAERLLSDKIL